MAIGLQEVKLPAMGGRLGIRSYIGDVISYNHSRTP